MKKDNCPDTIYIKAYNGKTFYFCDFYPTKKSGYACITKDGEFSDYGSHLYPIKEHEKEILDKNK